MISSTLHTHVGLMLVILSPFLDFTHSLLIHKPVGCLYFTPLGAVSSTSRSDMLMAKYNVFRSFERTEMR